MAVCGRCTSLLISVHARVRHFIARLLDRVYRFVNEPTSNIELIQLATGTGGNTMNERREILPLTGIRALAAWLVVVLHLGEQFPAWIASPLHRTLHFGSNGVDLFFTLSGIIIAYTYGAQLASFSAQAYRNFLVKRVARLYPASVVALALLGVFGASLVVTGRNPDFFTQNTPLQLLGHLTLTSNWSLQVIPYTWNVPAWSISMEWLAYLLFPLLWRGVLRLGQTGLVLLVAALMLAMCLLVTTTTLNDGVIRVLSEFTVGMCLFRLSTLGAFAAAPLPFIGGLCLVLFVALGVWLGWHSDQVRLVVPLLVPVLYALLLQRGALARFCALPFVAYWGRVSYSLYITHFVALAVFRLAFNLAGSDPLRLMAATLLQLGLIVVLAVATYRLVEEPGRLWLGAALKRVFTLPVKVKDRRPL